MGAGNTSVETKVKDAVLQESRKVKVGDREYDAPVPTLGTLLMVSSLISKIPDIPDSNSTAVVVGSASCSDAIAEIAATLILGAKSIKKAGNRPFRKLLAAITHSPTPLDALKEDILDNYSAHDALDLILSLLGNARLPDFFVLTTFLREASLTKPTKVVKTKTTARGRSSQA